MALIVDDVVVACGHLYKLSTRGAWCDHKLEDIHYVIVKVTKLICGKESKHCPYPTCPIANMHNCMDREVLGRAHNCRPTTDNESCPSQGSTIVESNSHTQDQILLKRIIGWTKCASS